MPARLSRRALVFGVPAVLAAPTWSARASDAWRPRVAKLAEGLLKEGVVGCVAAVVRPEGTDILGWGETRRGSGRVPDADTVYEIGSITKTFTSLLLAEQLLAGKLALDTPVQELLPAGVRMNVVGEPITLKHLVTHTSGFPRRPDNLGTRDRLDPYAEYTTPALYEYLARFVPPRPPGTFEYSNLAFGLLGHVLALQAGRTLDQLLQERIATPLALADTRLDTTTAMAQRLATPTDERGREVRPWHLAVLGGAGGLRSTARDLVRVMRAQIAREDTPLGRAMRLTHRRQFTHPDGKGIGLAWRLSRDDRIPHHGGSTGGYRAWMGLEPQRGMGLVLLTNTASAKVYPAADRMLQALLGREGALGDAE